MSGRRTDRPEWAQVRRGLLLLGGLVAAAVLVFFLDDLRRSLEEGPRLVVEMEEAPALEPGSDVWVAGRPAGRVTRVRFLAPQADRPGSLLIHAVLHRDAAGAVRADASARVRESSLLAPMVLAIQPGSPEAPPYDYADTLRRITESFDREAVMALADSLRALLRESRPVVSRLVAALREGPGTLGALRTDTAVVAELRESLDRLDRLLPEGGAGFPGRLVRDTALSAHLRSATASLRELRALREGPASGPGDVEALREMLERLLDGLAAVERDLLTGRGTWGRAMYDTAILEQARLLRARMDSVRAELLARPLRWLRFRLF